MRDDVHLCFGRVRTHDPARGRVVHDDGASRLAMRRSMANWKKAGAEAEVAR